MGLRNRVGVREDRCRSRRKLHETIVGGLSEKYHQEFMIDGMKANMLFGAH